MGLPKIQFFPALENEKFNVVTEDPDRIVVLEKMDMSALPKVPTVVIDPTKRMDFNELVSFFGGLTQMSEVWSTQSDDRAGIEKDYEYIHHTDFLDQFDCILDPSIVIEDHKIPKATNILLNGDFFDALIGILHGSKSKFNIFITNTVHPFGWQQFLALPRTANMVRAHCNIVDHPRVNGIPKGFVKSDVGDESNEKSLLCYVVPLRPEDSLGQAISKNCVDSMKSKAPGDWLNIEQTGEYKGQLAKSKFVVCPPITGLESPLFWEAKNAGAIPIVLQTPMASLYRPYGCVVVDSWEQVTEEFLSQFI